MTQSAGRAAAPEAIIGETHSKQRPVTLVDGSLFSITPPVSFSYFGIYFVFLAGACRVGRRIQHPRTVLALL